VPEALSPDAIDELRVFNAALEPALAATPLPEATSAAEQRALARAGGVLPPPVLLPQARELTIPGRGDAIRLRVLAPETGATGIYVHLHGGGWALGECDLQDEALWALVQATGLCAVSVGYRLAPEHPYPAAPDDCEDATAWILEHGLSETGAPDRFVIGGESAGAHLAAVTLLRLRDARGTTDAFRGANLVFGSFDLTGTPSQRLWGERRLVIARSTLQWFVEQFTPGFTDEQRMHPDVSPLYADLRDLPPARFSVGALDPLLDDSLFMAARWQAAGNRTELAVYPESPHAFTAFELAAARACNDAQHRFLRDCVQ
jgi:acetyl esterase/lipase